MEVEEDSGLLHPLRVYLLSLPLQQLRAWIRTLRRLLVELEAHSETLAESAREARRAAAQ